MLRMDASISVAEIFMAINRTCPGPVNYVRRSTDYDAAVFARRRRLLDSETVATDVVFLSTRPRRQKEKKPRSCSSPPRLRNIDVLRPISSRRK